MAKLSNCKNEKCGKELSHTEGRRPKKFCSEKCRIEFHNLGKIKGVGRGRPKGSKNKLKPNAIDRIEAENRNNPLTNAARGRDEGGVNKDEIKKVSVKGFIAHTHTIPVYDVKPQSEWTSEMNCISLPKPFQKYDFGTDTILFMSKYTKHPEDEAPKNILAYDIWKREKNKSDAEIRAAFNIHLQELRSKK